MMAAEVSNPRESVLAGIGSTIALLPALSLPYVYRKALFLRKSNG